MLQTSKLQLKVKSCFLFCLKNKINCKDNCNNSSSPLHASITVSVFSIDSSSVWNATEGSDITPPKNIPSFDAFIMVVQSAVDFGLNGVQHLHRYTFG